MIKDIKPSIQQHSSLVAGQTHPLVAKLMARDRHTFGTAECMQRRRVRLSATDFSTIVHRLEIRGSNKYRSFAKWVHYKLGLLPRTTNPACEHGIKYEEEAIRAYSEATGNVVISDIGWMEGGPEDTQLDVPTFVGATPDAVCAYLPILVEIKCPFFKLDFPNEVEDLYWPQIQVQMAVTGIHTVHFVHYVPESACQQRKICITEAKFDPEWWAVAIAEARYVYEYLTLMHKGVAEAPPLRKRKKSLIKCKVPKKKKCRLALNTIAKEYWSEVTTGRQGQLKTSQSASTNLSTASTKSTGSRSPTPSTQSTSATTGSILTGQ